MALQPFLPSVLEDLQVYLRKAAFTALLGPQTCPCSPFSNPRHTTRLMVQQMLEGWGTKYNLWMGIIYTKTTGWFCQALMMEVWGTCVGVDLRVVGSRKKKRVIGSSQTNWYGLTHQAETPNWMFLAQGGSNGSNNLLCLVKIRTQSSWTLREVEMLEFSDVPQNKDHVPREIRVLEWIYHVTSFFHWEEFRREWPSW